MQTASFSKPAVNPAGFSASDAVSAAWSDGAAARSGHGAAFDVALFRIAGRAAALDSAPAFPAEDMAELHRAGLLLAPLPEALGGSGWGTSPEGAAPLLTALRRLGAANLSVGRLYEAHVNAVVLISAYGRPEQVEAAARDAEAGHCFGLWVTDGAAPLRLSGGLLIGGKAVCSGAGHISRALVTAMLPDGSAQMALVAPQLAAPGGAGDGSARLTGMHAAVTGAVAMTGLPADPLGKPGDYLREPFFSAGAWRTAAVTLGGLERLVHCVGAELGARGRADNPHQRAFWPAAGAGRNRFAMAVTDRGTSRGALHARRHRDWLRKPGARRGRAGVPRGAVAGAEVARVERLHRRPRGGTSDA